MRMYTFKLVLDVVLELGSAEEAVEVMEELAAVIDDEDPERLAGWLLSQPITLSVDGWGGGKRLESSSTYCH